MTNAREPEDQPRQAGALPADVPPGRPAALDRLDALAGEWETRATFAAGYFGPGSAAVTGPGRTSFGWLTGRHFLIQRFGADHPAAPGGIAVIGLNDDGETFAQHYYDSRGVARVYQMSLAGPAWRLWRESPGFWQRYSGTLAADGSRIEGAWEFSADGRAWSRDFSLDYLRVG